MLKRIFSLTLAAVMMLGVCSLCACNRSAPEAPEGTVTRMTVDINPGVEFMIDDENKVVSVTALNDDGAILIAGESFIGKTPEEAVELVVKLSGETGYLVKGNVSADENIVKISVSGDSEYADYIRESVEEKTKAVFEKLDISGKVEKAEEMNLSALRELAKETTLYSDEEIDAMTEDMLYRVIAAGRIETALLLTEEMRNAYYNVRDYEISFAEREETAKVIEAMGGIYQLVYLGYKTALDSYSAAITALDDFRYQTLISPDSEYQKSLAALREAKTELLAQKNYTASLDVNGEEYSSATVTLQMSEETYQRALEAYETIGELANQTLEALIANLRVSEEALRSLEANFIDDIQEELTAKADEIEAAMNQHKDNFFAKFEETHGEDLKTIENDLIVQKQKLLDAVEQSKNK